MIDKKLLSELVELRHTLHAFPELSGQERETALLIRRFIGEVPGARWVSFKGSFSFALVIEAPEPGPSILLRADIDALPICEENNFGYRSRYDGVSHKCGHDGHATIMAGVANFFKNNTIMKGSVVILFQAEEETGKGARFVIESNEFVTQGEVWKFDYAFALHNYPGLPLGDVFAREGCMAAASTGLIIRLEGKTSHAAEPERGVSPLAAMSYLLTWLKDLPTKETFDDFVLVTPVHARMGEQAFGTSPGEAVIMATLRSFSDYDLKKLCRVIEQEVKVKCFDEGLRYSLEYTESFSITKNHPEGVALVRKAAIKNSMSFKELDNPFRWSEDFGLFTRHSKGGFFVIGSGENHPKLHNPDYDFPDELIGKGVDMFVALISEIFVINKR